MKTYSGDRTIDGVQVVVDGAPLPERRDLHDYTRNGFEWSYEGPEPSQLALALLADHLGSGEQAVRHAQAFMRGVVANFNNEWTMTSADIDRALVNLGIAARGRDAGQHAA